MQAKSKKILFRIIAIVVAAAVVGLIVFFVIRAIRNIDDMLTMEELRYDEYSTDYDPDVDSWLQIDPDDEDVEIRWWVDSTTWDFYQLSDLIYRRTGVRVKFEKALTGDGQELSTMIAGTLPDVITITDYSTRVQLAEEGYVYSIDRLAESYAPSMLSRLPQELRTYYAGSDGHVYGVANNFYSDSDISEYEDAGGSVLSNYAVVVRQDYLNDYLAYMREQDPGFDADSEVTTPEGFIDMCLWVKENKGLGNDNPTVCLSEFMTKASNGSISYALSALMQFFCVPREDADGNLVYEYATEEFQEVILFLNRLFNEHLVISSNFGYSSSNIVTNIRNGRPFAVIGAIQNYSTGFEKYSAAGYDAETGTFSESNEYVPIVLTNSDGDAPLLADMTGRGLRVSMITKDAVRVDRIIKVFDYLLSEQGQRECYYGETEGEYYNFVVRPGETRTITVNGEQVEHTYTYGQIEWTDKAKELLGAANGSGWYNAGIKQISLLQNPLYVALTSVNGAEMDTYQFYVRYNQKCALIPYTYSNIPFRYNVDTSDVDTYNAMTDLQATLENVWIEALPSIIMAPNSEQALSLYESALERAKSRGYERWLEFQNASFRAYKQSLGIEYKQDELKIGEDSLLTYEVRKTAEDFCRKLVNHSAKNLLESYNSIEGAEGFDDFIMDRGWFYWSWRYDPTVRSMLVVLNELATIVQKSEDDRFSDANKCYQNLEHIVFYFLDLGEFNMGEELYVKMNARGKDLSSFDILKSLLEEEMQKQKCSNVIQIEWRKRMDIRWIDYFWQAFRKKRVESAELVQEIEEQYKKFLLILIGYELYLDNIMPIEECFDFDKSIFRYEKIANEKRINFEKLMKWFDSILFEEDGKWNDVTSLLDFDWDKNDNRSLIDLTLENCTNDRLVFCYAVIKFCERNFAEKIYNDTAIKNNFIGWMRFVRNIWLIENGGSSRINNIKDVGNAITCIDAMVDSWRSGDIYSFINERKDEERRSFSAVSLMEEKIKARLISDPINGAEWKEKIIQAENHGYLWGQIICLLEWARKDSTYDIGLFETYYQKFCEIIPDTGEISDENKFLFYRAMLAASDYSKITFHNTLLTFDKDRDYSLKNYLRNEWPEGIVGKCVKDLLDEWSQDHSEQTTFKGFAQKFIDDNKECITKTDWRSLLLQREDCVPVLCNFSKWMRFKKEDNVVYILGKNSKRKKEYFLAYLIGKLKNISYNDENDAKTVSFSANGECQYKIEANGFQKYTVMKNESIQEKDIPYDKVCEFLCYEELLS